MWGGRDLVMPTPSQLDGTGLHDLSVAGGALYPKP